MRTAVPKYRRPTGQCRGVRITHQMLPVCRPRNARRRATRRPKPTLARQRLLELLKLPASTRRDLPYPQPPWAKCFPSSRPKSDKEAHCSIILQIHRCLVTELLKMLRELNLQVTCFERNRLKHVMRSHDRLTRFLPSGQFHHVRSLRNTAPNLGPLAQGNTSNVSKPSRATPRSIPIA